MAHVGLRLALEIQSVESVYPYDGDDDDWHALEQAQPQRLTASLMVRLNRDLPQNHRNMIRTMIRSAAPDVIIVEGAVVVEHLPVGEGDRAAFAAEVVAAVVAICH